MITDKIFEAAWQEYIQSRYTSNRQAIRAALETGCGQCIEELAAALELFANKFDTDPRVLRACDALKRWGLEK